MDKLLKSRYESFHNPELLQRIKEAKETSEIHSIVKSMVSDKEDETDLHEKRKATGELVDVLLNFADPKEMLRRHNVFQLLSSSNPSYIMELCNNLNVLIPPKIRKKGKMALMRRIIEKYNSNERLQTKLDWYSSQSIMLSYPFIKDKDIDFDSFKQQLEDLLVERESDPVTQTVMFTCMLFDTPSEEHIVNMLENYTDLMWDHMEEILINSFLLHCEYVYAPSETSQPPTIKQLLLERKELSKKVAKHEKQQNRLKTEIHERQKNEKELKSTIHGLNKQLQEQLDSALAEIERLETQVISLEEDKFVLENDNIFLRQTLERNQNLKPFAPLQGKTICVVGSPDKRDKYRSIIEKYGGKFEFYPSILETGLSSMAGPVGRADVVMYLTTFTNHTIGNKLKSLIDVSRIKPLHYSGIGYFENELLTKVITPLIEQSEQTNIVGG